MYEEQEENYWPGYVDALSTMTMVLTFVMMILGIAVFILSQNVSRVLVQKMVAEIGLDLNIGSNPSVETFTREVRVALAEAREARATSSPTEDTNQTSDIVAVDPEQTIERNVEKSEEPEQRQGTGVQSTTSEAMITLNFRPDVFRIDEATGEALTDFLQRNGQTRENARVEIRADANVSRGALSEARRVAYYRAMQVRGALLQGGLVGSNISVRIEDVTDEERLDRVRVFALGSE